MKYLLITLYLLSFQALAQTDSNLSNDEQKEKILNFSNIQSVLKNDGLIKERQKKAKLVKEIKKERKKILQKKYRYPTNSDFWKIMSEYWLVKNAQVLQWDFPKPEYGIIGALKGLLEKLGFYNKDIKLLVVNSPTMTHMALPLAKDEYLFILSLPFMRTLDLTKVDLSILLLEDFIRINNGYFQDNINVDKSKLGESFMEADFDKALISKTLSEYSKMIFEKGFNFQQQFEVTKEMSRLLKSQPVLWSSYFKLLTKINRLIKNDLLYKDYLKIYPSPELQLQWLKPKKEIL